MPGKKSWDLTSTSALQSAARWLLKGSGALLVVIVRVDDLAIAADPLVAPRETIHLLEDRMPALHERLQRERIEAQQLAERKRERENKKLFHGGMHA